MPSALRKRTSLEECGDRPGEKCYRRGQSKTKIDEFHWSRSILGNPETLQARVVIEMASMHDLLNNAPLCPQQG